MYDVLFQPVRIGRVEIKNRIVLSPMVVHYAGSRGEMTERMIRYYEERAKGGAGLILTETTLINEDGRAIIRNPGMFSDELIPGWSTFADAIHFHGARCGVQLGHGGNQGPNMVVDMVSASAIPRNHSRTPRELTLEEIDELIELWGEAARRTKDAGIDFVEEHGSHGYLIGQFCSPLTNRRTDKYGADRDLFAVEILKRIKEKCGKDYPVIYRLNSDEFLPGGITVAEAKITAQKLEAAGLDALDITGSNKDTLDYLIPPMYYDRERFWEFIKNAREIKKVVSIPVISGGFIADPETAVKAIEEGYVDMIYLGRGLIADPEWPRKVREGRVNEIRKCIACDDGCGGRLFEGRTTWCAVNPFHGFEYRFGSKPTPAEVKKKVVVVGGGPAGMQAALVAAQRGHNVTLIEKDKQLGGATRIAGIPDFKKRVRTIAEWYNVALPKAGVKLELGKEATASSVLAMKPDAVIVATGAKPLVPRIAGAENAITVDDALLGKEVGSKVVVIGGGLAGIEAALYYSAQGKDITVIEMLGDILADANYVNKLALTKLLAKTKVKIITGLRVEEIRKKSVTACNEFGAKTTFNADTAILACGRVSENALVGQLKGKIPELHAVGDCASPGLIIDAIHAGFGVAMFM